MDDQSFQLLMSKLSGLEDGQARIEQHLNDRLHEHLKTIQQHIEDDKILAANIAALNKDVSFAKGVTYAVNGVSAAAAWFMGWSK